MRGSSSVTRRARRRTAILGLLATFVSFALLACGVAVADTVTSNFENPPFTQATVNGQDGWKSGVGIPPVPQYDQGVVNNAGIVPAFGAQSLRMSNLRASSEFTNQTYSKRVTQPAGETQDNSEYTAQFSFISKTPNAVQPGLVLTVSPDSYEGSRMSWVSLEDTPDGIRVRVSDSPEEDGDFAYYDGGLLSRGVPHTIRFWIKVNPGPDNDLVRVFIDGDDVGQCFATWENYYRTASEQEPPPNRNNPANINSLQFRSSVKGPDALAATGGFLFDNVSITTANGPGPPGCDLVLDKDADTRTVTAGGHARFAITARNRGGASARNVQVCDRIPRRMTFVRADRKLSRVGRRLCFVIQRLGPGQRVSVNLTFGVDASAPQGTITNIADLTPGVERPGLPGTPGAGNAPRPPAAGDVPRPPARLGARTPERRARAVVRILARQGGPPSVTG